MTGRTRDGWTRDSVPCQLGIVGGRRWNKKRWEEESWIIRRERREGRKEAEPVARGNQVSALSVAVSIQCTCGVLGVRTVPAPCCPLRFFYSSVKHEFLVLVWFSYSYFWNLLWLTKTGIKQQWKSNCFLCVCVCVCECVSVYVY